MHLDSKHQEKALGQLVNKLLVGKHRIILARTKTLDDLVMAIKDNFVLLLFPDTNGGTELGVRLDRNESRVNEADLTTGTGVIYLVGQLTLDFQAVVLRAEIEVQRFAGQAWLEATAN